MAEPGVNQDDDRTREPPAERFAAGELAFDLRAEIESLKAEGPPSSAGHRQKTLYKHGDATIALFLFERGGGLPQHEAAGAVTIHVIDGWLTVTTGPGRAYDLRAGHLLALAPDIPHAVTAREQSAMVLQVHLDRNHPV